MAITNPKTLETRKRILDRNSPRLTVVPSKTLGFNIGIRALSARQAFLLLAGGKNEDGRTEDEKLVPALLIATLCDAETGELLLSPPDRDVVLEMEAEVVTELSALTLEHCGIKGKSENEILKNSSGTGSSEATSFSLNGSEPPSSN